MHGKQGFTLLELLIVLGILGIILGISVMSGQRILRGQEERAALHSFRQAVTRAATAANAKKAQVVVRKVDDKLMIRDLSAGTTLQSYDLPESVQFRRGGNEVTNEQVIAFGPNGKVASNSGDGSLDLDALQFSFETDTKAYDLEVSLIGEVKVTPR